MSTLNSERLPGTHRKCFDSKVLRPYYVPFVRQHRRAPRSPHARNPEGAHPKVAHLRQPRTTAVNPARGCSRDRNEEQDPGLHRYTVERNKEGNGFVRFRWGETQEQGAGDGARLAIEIGADFPIGIRPKDSARGKPPR